MAWRHSRWIAYRVLVSRQACMAMVFVSRGSIFAETGLRQPRVNEKRETTDSHPTSAPALRHADSDFTLIASLSQSPQFSANKKPHFPAKTQCRDRRLLFVKPSRLAAALRAFFSSLRLPCVQTAQATWYQAAGASLAPGHSACVPPAIYPDGSRSAHEFSLRLCHPVIQASDQHAPSRSLSPRSC